MFGVNMTTGPVDWEIFQHHQGQAKIEMTGTYQVPEAAIDQGIASATPIYRILMEDNHEILIDWTPMTTITPGENWSGVWICQVALEKGGLYLIETGLDTWSTREDLHWIFRGDTRRHIGVGNLFIIAGQSNAAGYGRDAAYDPPAMGVHFFRNNDSWEIASHPMNDGTDGFTKIVNMEMGISGTSPYLSFAKAFMDLSGAPVGLIPTALGGSPMTRWIKSEKGDLYVNMLNRLTCLEKKTLAHATDDDHRAVENEKGRSYQKYAGLLWYQGCSDAIPGEADLYLKRFETFVHDLRRDLGQDLPVFTFQLNRELASEHDHQWGILRNVQRLASQSLSHVYVMPTHDSPLCDGIHNNSSANVKLGKRLAKQAAGILLGQKAFFAPEPIKLELIQDKVLEITFNHCPYGLQLFDRPDKPNGFTIMDGGQEVDITGIKIPPDRPDTIRIFASQVLSEKTSLSYCWEANPSYPVIAEKSNYLPIVAFYKFEISK